MGGCFKDSNSSKAGVCILFLNVTHVWDYMVEVIALERGLYFIIAVDAYVRGIHWTHVNTEIIHEIMLGLYSQHFVYRH